MHEKDKANLIDCLYSIEHIEEYTHNILTADDLFEERKSPYDATFVSMIEESKKQTKQGELKAIKTTDLWK